MGIAKNVVQEQVCVGFDLTFAVEPPAGIIQVDVSQAVEAPIILAAQFIQFDGIQILRISLFELRFLFLQ